MIKTIIPKDLASPPSIENGMLTTIIKKGYWRNFDLKRYTDYLEAKINYKPKTTPPCTK